MEFYVYVYLDSRKNGNFIYEDFNFTFEPFYVGKGKNKRFSEHTWKSRLKYRNFKTNKIKSMLDEGYSPIIVKIKENLSENEAFDLEKHLINIIGRHDIGLGPLTNLTNGGDGISGLIKTKEHRKNLSISSFGKKMSEESKRKISESLKGKPGRNTGNKHTKKTKNKISKSKKGKVSWNAETVLQYDKKMNFIKEWRSATHAAKELKLSQGGIWQVLNNLRKTCGNYIWKYKNN